MKPTRIDLTAQRFGRLVVIGFARTEKKHTMWECICDCGNIHIVYSNHLRSGAIKSCGCLNAKLASKRNRTHGESNSNTTKEYRAWNKIKTRCYTTTNKRYKDYGARGIVMCDHWKDSYENFLEDMGRAPSSKHSIERLENEKGYSKENCKWATDLEQANNKRNNHFVEYNGEKLTLAQWSRKLSINTRSLSYWVTNKGLSIDEILEKIKNKKPPKIRKKRKENYSYGKRELIYKSGGTIDFEQTRLTPKRENLIGQKFERLTVVGFAGTKKRSSVWKCKYTCGKMVNVVSFSLKSGHTLSCGCYAREINAKRLTKHGDRFTKEYSTWQGIIARCTNSANISYPNYGGRGITICDEWLHSYEKFLKDMGRAPHKKLTLDRIENNLGYYKENCRWATNEIQQANRRKKYLNN